MYAHQPNTQFPSPSEPSNGAEDQKYSILVIEDDKALGILTQEILEERGHRVFLASTGNKGIEMAQELNPQVVISDLRLSLGMSGYDVAKALKANPAVGSYLIAISAHDESEFKDKALACGFDQTLSKPIDVERLERMLSQEQHFASS